MVAPSLAGWVATLAIDATVKHQITGGLLVFASLVKGFEYVLGEGDEKTNINPPAK